jgi:uncharacterized protein YggE
MFVRTLAALLLLAVFGGCAAGARHEPRAPRLISARGVGKVAVKPDVAVVHVGAEMRAPILADASGEVARRMTAVLARLKALGVADRDLTTVVYSMDAVPAPRRAEEDPSRIAGYRVTNIVQVKIRDLAAVGRVLDEAVGAGANTISSLQFTVDDPSKPEAEARALAVKAAASTAQQLAAAAGVSLGELVSLTEGTTRPVVERMPAMARAAMAAGPVESGQLEIAVSVEAHYRIAP